jgi:hypothetical protein
MHTALRMQSGGWANCVPPEVTSNDDYRAPSSQIGGE